MELKAKIWLEIDGKPIIGEGKAKLLELIKEKGSINKSAKEMGLSYRYAWGVIKDIEKNLGQPIVASIRGGVGGGKTRLTKKGEDLLKEFKRKEKEFEQFLDEKSF